MDFDLLDIPRRTDLDLDDLEFRRPGVKGPPRKTNAKGRLNVRQHAEAWACREDMEILTMRLGRLVEHLPADIQEGFDDALLQLSRAGTLLDETLDDQSSGDRMYRRVARLPALTVWPEYLPAVCLLGVRHLHRPWWRPSLKGTTVALHAARRWGGRSDVAAKPRAIDRICGQLRRDGFAEDEIRRYTLAASGLEDGWRDLAGSIKATAKIVDASYEPGDDLWKWALSEVRVLSAPVPAKSNGPMRNLWRPSRDVVERVLEQIVEAMP
jgi:hypothetical protein